MKILLLALGLLCAGLAQGRIAGSIHGAAAAAGHRLRGGAFPAPAHFETVGTVIVGAGVAGLAAARALDKAGRKDLLILELEQSLGGTAMGVNSPAGGFPWGAHYVPLPGQDEPEMLALFKDLGVITGQDAKGRPIYDETFLVHDPQERLFLNGHWQEGHQPRSGFGPGGEAQFKRFGRAMAALRQARGSDGRRAFAIPVDSSSRDERFRSLDRRTMQAWLAREAYTEPLLLWTVNFDLRDDFGAGSDKISAWAGLHYYAARGGWAANAGADEYVTWPQGNGYLVERLAEGLQDRARTGCLVYAVRATGSGVEVDYLDLASGSSVRVKARHVVLAVPHFVARHLVEAWRENPPMDAQPFIYSPWLVANLALKELPDDGPAPLAWDNLIYSGRSLGYVFAGHQSLERVPQPPFWLTYYEPLDEGEPAAERESALKRDHSQWAQRVLKELKLAHPDLEKNLQSLEVWVWGHGMIRPVPGFIWGEARQAAARPLGRIHFANTDLSGVALFEEAYHQGLRAAREVLAAP